ncbi:MAG: ferrous iron transport protein A [Peptococcaceae bacterium]|jgi:ferrous iron transport protein A|nr:ferrous iron transport protein A [Peptococcaceae bacterium]
MPLTLARPGETIRIKKISGHDDIKRHLESLGFVAGEQLTIVNEISGNLILIVKGARVALDKTMASRIHIAMGGAIA